MVIQIEKRLLTEYIDEVNYSERTTYGIKVLQSGRTVDEHHWVKDTAVNVYSIAKNVVSAAVGLAINEGLIDLETTLAELFPEYVNKENEVHLSEITVYHLLTLTIGEDTPHLMLNQIGNMIETDWLAYTLNQRFSHFPGKRFLYSNTGAYLNGRAIEKRTGISLVEYLKPRIFEPLGIKKVHWDTDLQGNTFAAAGLYLTLNDLSKFAQLYLQNGKWKGQTILSPEWIKESSKARVKTNSTDPYTDYYGFGFWINSQKTIYRADGAGGQLAMIIPEKQSVICITSESSDNVWNMEKIYQWILPKL